MKINWGINIEEYHREVDSMSMPKLKTYLNKGSLSLVLGAGVSMSTSLPSWLKLVELCAQDTGIAFDSTKSYTNEELKSITEKIKKAGADEYLNIVKRNLYNDFEPDFRGLQKDLLIAISALIIGKVRGNVQKVLTYNFDSILEWYLIVNGLTVNAHEPKNRLNVKSDVDIIHTHGFLPFDHLPNCYPSSTIVFSKNEFSRRLVSSNNIEKQILYDFFIQNVFLSIGVGPKTLLDDIGPFLNDISENYYELNGIQRDNPYGFAFISPLKGEAEERSEQLEDIFNIGIVPIELKIDNIPMKIFEIAQLAAGIKL